MSGPALRQLHSHKSIHEGAFVEARELMILLREFFEEKKENQAKAAAQALIEHWETRTLAHAESEEDGFYNEKTAQDPSLSERITKLKRDHDLMRILVEEMKEILAMEGVTKSILDRMEALLLIVQIHSREEELYLFS